MKWVLLLQRLADRRKWAGRRKALEAEDRVDRVDRVDRWGRENREDPRIEAEASRMEENREEAGNGVETRPKLVVVDHRTRVVERRNTENIREGDLRPVGMDSHP